MEHKFVFWAGKRSHLCPRKSAGKWFSAILPAPCTVFSILLGSWNSTHLQQPMFSTRQISHSLVYKYMNLLVLLQKVQKEETTSLGNSCFSLSLTFSNLILYR